MLAQCKHTDCTVPKHCACIGTFIKKKYKRKRKNKWKTQKKKKIVTIVATVPLGTVAIVTIQN